MRVLLDTHVLVWALVTPGRISPKVAEILKDGRNNLVWSVLGTAELAVKVGKGSLKLPEPLDAWFADRRARLNLEILHLRQEHALRVATLPRHHRDPFDRLLVAQAQVEDIPLITRDARLRSYEVEVIW